MSSIIRTAVLSAACLLSATFAFAQQTPADAASAAMPGASMPHDCKARHDHAAEKGMPTPKAAMCADAPASAAKSKTKAPAHDHGKFHKNQG